MLFNSISLFAFLASSALAAPTSPPTYSTTNDNAASVAPTYNSNSNTDSYTRIQTLHTEVYHWTAQLNSTRDAYATCTTDAERQIYTTQLKSQFTSLQQCVDSAQSDFQQQNYQHHNAAAEQYASDVRDCVQEIKYTGEGLIPILGHDVVAPLLGGVVKSLNGLLGALLPLVGGVLNIVGGLLGGVLDLLF